MNIINSGNAGAGRDYIGGHTGCVSECSMLFFVNSFQLLVAGTTVYCIGGVKGKFKGCTTLLYWGTHRIRQRALNVVLRKQGWMRVTFCALKECCTYEFNRKSAYSKGNYVQIVQGKHIQNCFSVDLSKLEKFQSLNPFPNCSKIFCMRRHEEGGKLTTGDRERM